MNHLILLLGLAYFTLASPTPPSASTEIPQPETILPPDLSPTPKLHQRSSGARHLPISSAIVDPEDVMYLMPQFSTLYPTKDEAKKDQPQSKQNLASAEDAPASEIADQGNQRVQNEANAAIPENMETSSAIVFRPLFVYRQQQAEKRRWQAKRNSYNQPTTLYGGASYYQQPPVYGGATSAYQPERGNQGYYIYVPQTRQYVHVPHGYPPVPAGTPQIPYQYVPNLAPPSNYL